MRRWSTLALVASFGFVACGSQDTRGTQGASAGEQASEPAPCQPLEPWSHDIEPEAPVRVGRSEAGDIYVWPDYESGLQDFVWVSDGDELVPYGVDGLAWGGDEAEVSVRGGDRAFALYYVAPDELYLQELAVNPPDEEEPTPEGVPADAEKLELLDAQVLEDFVVRPFVTSAQVNYHAGDGSNEAPFGEVVIMSPRVGPEDERLFISRDDTFVEQSITQFAPGNVVTYVEFVLDGQEASVLFDHRPEENEWMPTTGAEMQVGDRKQELVAQPETNESIEGRTFRCLPRGDRAFQIPEE